MHVSIVEDDPVIAKAVATAVREAGHQCTWVADGESAIRDIEQQMSAPGFYEDHTASKPVIDRHQELMWKVGELMHQWEELQSAADLAEV